MDVSTFFSRLLQAPKDDQRVAAPDDIVEFDAAWAVIKETLQYPDERQLSRGIEATEVPAKLRHIIDALLYEAGQTDDETTGACLEYLLRHDLLSTLERLCEPDRPRGVKGEVLKTINDLVVSLPERFLVHNAVHRPLRRLLRSCIGDETEEKVDGVRLVGAAGMEVKGMPEDIESALVDLMCTLASRMRAYPPLLLIFFHDRGWLQDAPLSPRKPPLSKEQRQPHHFEFLLFSYLLRFAHREGRTGDLARAGLLFLFDIAFLTAAEEGGENLSMPLGKDGADPLQDARDAFGEYILDGDFAEVMAAGLGAIYSLLPSKLRVPGLGDAGKDDGAGRCGGMYLGTKLDEKDEDEENVVQSSTDPDVCSQLDLLLKLLGFLQDIIHRCHSPVLYADPNSDKVSNTHLLGTSISEATLDAVQASFLDNILYPSILECSPTDGSAVAVLTYLDVIFSNLDDGPLLKRILCFLMEGDAASGGFDEARFTLRDLVLDSIHSSCDPASCAGLKLLQTLFSSHCRRVTPGLIKTIRDPTATTLARPFLTGSDGDTFLPRPVTLTNVHLEEIELYGSLISRVDPSQSTAENARGYASYLSDALAVIQADGCFVSSRVPFQFANPDSGSDSEGQDEVKPVIRIGPFDADPFLHRMSPGDPLVRSLLDRLGRLICQTPDENVSLTGVLTALALCPTRSLAGWLLYDAPDQVDPWTRLSNGSSEEASDASDDDEAGDRRSEPAEDPFSAKQETRRDEGTGVGAGAEAGAGAAAGEHVDLPAVYQVLRDLVRQINRFRLDVDDFDKLLSERRRGLLFTDGLDEALNVPLDVETGGGRTPATPTRAHRAGSVSSNLTPGAGAMESPVRRPLPSLVGGIRSFLTPKRKHTPVQGPLQSNAQDVTCTPSPSSSLPRGARGSLAAKPFRKHYEDTFYFSLEARGSPPVASGSWSPSNIPAEIVSPAGYKRSGLAEGGGRGVRDGTGGVTGSEMVSVFSIGGGEGGTAQAQPQAVKVTLSSVLDNCIILEEFIKETVAVIAARRALGVDLVGFV